MVGERGGSGIRATDGARFAGREDRADSALSGRDAKPGRLAGERLLGAGGATNSSSNLALTPHVAERFVEADWMRTELPNAGGNVQNGLQLGACIVVRIR